MNMGPCYVLTVKLKVQVYSKPLPTQILGGNLSLCFFYPCPLPSHLKKKRCFVSVYNVSKYDIEPPFLMEYNQCLNGINLYKIFPIQRNYFQLHLITMLHIQYMQSLHHRLTLVSIIYHSRTSLLFKRCSILICIYFMLILNSRFDHS